MISADDEGRDASVRMQSVAQLMMLFDQFIAEEMQDLTAGDLVDNYHTSLLTMQWEKNFISLFNRTITVSQSSLEISEAALAVLTDDQDRQAISDTVQPSLVQDEAELAYTFIEYTAYHFLPHLVCFLRFSTLHHSNPYSWSPSAANLSTPVVAIHISYQGA